MTIFLSTLGQMAILFTLIIVGFIIAKLKVVPDNTSTVLARLENNVFIPALVLGTFMDSFTVEKLSIAWKLLAFSSVLTVIMALLAFFIARACSKDVFTQNVFTYGLAFSNFGFVGNAVVMSIFSDIFMDYLIFTLPLWVLIYLWGVPVLLIPSEDGKKGIASRLRSFVNPMFVCMIIGMLLGLTGIGAVLPKWIPSVISTAGDCMSPVAMILTGITVSSISIRKAFTSISIYAVSVIRLLVFPLAFIGIMHFFPSIDKTIYICAVCSLAMPLGLNTIVIPSAYGKDPTTASGMAVVSHLLSCITIPLIFMLI